MHKPLVVLTIFSMMSVPAAAQTAPAGQIRRSRPSRR